MKRLPLLALAAVIATSAGCLSTRNHRHIYSLDGAMDAQMQNGYIAKRPVMQLQRVLIPDYLDTTDILLRVGPHEIHESSTGRFGERLSLGVTHALRADLESRLPQDSITLTQSTTGPARQILVTVESFDVSPGGRCVLVADWSILDANRQTVLSVDRGTFKIGAAGSRPGDGAIVAAMADAVGQLAQRIASTIEALPPRMAMDAESLSGYSSAHPGSPAGFEKDGAKNMKDPDR
jgi:uncharacterized protein